MMYIPFIFPEWAACMISTVVRPILPDSLSSETSRKNFAEPDGGPEALVRRLFSDLEAWAETKKFRRRRC